MTFDFARMNKKGRLLVLSQILFWSAFVPACGTTPKSVQHAGQPGHHLWEYKRSHFNMYSLRDEIRIGENVQQQQMQAFKRKNLAIDPSEQSALKQRIESIVQRLAAVSDLPQLPFEVHVYDKPDVVNAFCMPGGKIGVYTGLFDPEKGLVTASSDDEIAAVLSHEIAHATMRHVTRQLTTSNGVGFLGNIISIGIGSSVGNNWQYAFNNVFSSGVSLMVPSYTRAHESEADKVGLYYMVKAGFDPEAAIRIWERAAQRNQLKGTPSRTHFMSSHPGSVDRAEHLRRFLPDVAEVKRQQQLIDSAKRDN